MKLYELQVQFTYNLAQMIILVGSTPEKSLVIKEVMRTKSQQLLYFHGYIVDLNNEVTGEQPIKFIIDKQPDTRRHRGLAGIVNGAHLDCLAADIALFVNGVYQTETNAYRELGDIWKSLHQNNVWGGDWGWDGNHFQMKKDQTPGAP